VGDQELPEADFDMPEPKRLMIAGDWHGDRGWAESAIRLAKEADCDAILHLGDWGYWPAYDEITQSQTGGCYFTTKIKEFTKRQRIPIYWLDGNHENHEALHPGQGDQWLRHLPRGHRWNWWGKTWMSVGGGVSVDKSVRTPGYDWFPGEVLSPVQLEYCLREGDVDVVVAHDCPTGVEIPGVHGQGKTKNVGGFFPPEAIAESEDNRALMGIIADEKKPAWWFHGHYHSRYNGEREQTKVFGLDKNRSHLNLNTVILTEKDLT
jgi:hypothetical protein